MSKQLDINDFKEDYRLVRKEYIAVVIKALQLEYSHELYNAINFNCVLDGSELFGIENHAYIGTNGSCLEAMGIEVPHYSYLIMRGGHDQSSFGTALRLANVCFDYAKLPDRMSNSPVHIYKFLQYHEVDGGEFGEFLLAQFMMAQFMKDGMYAVVWVDGAKFSIRDIVRVEYLNKIRSGKLVRIIEGTVYTESGARDMFEFFQEWKNARQ